MRPSNDNEEIRAALSALASATKPIARAALSASPDIVRAAFAALRVIVRADGPSRDPRGEIIQLNCGYGQTSDGDPVVPAGTLKTWAKEGRLQAFVVERGKLVAWDRDVRCAIEADRFAARPPQASKSPSSVADHDEDPAITALLGSGEWVAGERCA